MPSRHIRALLVASPKRGGEGLHIIHGERVMGGGWPRPAATRFARRRPAVARSGAGGAATGGKEMRNEGAW